LKVGVLGSLGLVILIYTVISLIQKVEEAFNYIWKVNKPRSFGRRFSDYMSVILIGPVLIFAAIGLTASVMSTIITRKLISTELLGIVVPLGSKIIPYIFVCAAFTFIYIFVPNTKIKFKSALVGGIFGGVLWETTGWGFASFVVSSTKYDAIYSGFAILILFMIWLYLSWLILLVGAKVSFYYQYPQFLTVKKESILLSNKLKERLAFLIIFLIGYNYYHNEHYWTFDSLISRLGLPLEPVQGILGVLEKKGLIVKTGDDPPVYLPAKDIEKITLKEVFNSVRVAEEETFLIEERFLSIPEIDKVIKRIDNAIEKTLGEDTIKNLILSSGG
jgi:membrane protein